MRLNIQDGLPQEDEPAYSLITLRGWADHEGWWLAH